MDTNHEVRLYVVGCRRNPVIHECVFVHTKADRRHDLSGVYDINTTKDCINISWFILVMDGTDEPYIIDKKQVNNFFIIDEVVKNADIAFASTRERAVELLNELKEREVRNLQSSIELWNGWISSAEERIRLFNGHT